MDLKDTFFCKRRGAAIQDRFFQGTLWGTALFLVVLIIFFFIELIDESKLSLRTFGWGFLWGRVWDPVTGTFGALPFIYGTIVSSLLALMLAGFVGVGASLFLTHYATWWIGRPIGFMIELLAAIPSVIYGIWGIFVMAPWLRSTVEPWLSKHFGFLPLFQGPAYGVGMLAGGLILAMMILPTITAIARDVILVVPASQKEGVLALGATHWEMIRFAVLPNAWPGIVGGLMLGLGRALGETMAVTMVIGNRPEIAVSLFAPAYTMASVIANEFTEATSKLYLSALSEIGLLLLVVTIVFQILARFLVHSVAKRGWNGA